MNFDIKRLNSKMNCKCLQSIIKNDKRKYDVDETRLGIKCQQKTLNVELLFGTLISYTRLRWDDADGHIHARERETCGIPFFFCPICGKKTKNIIPKDSFYYKIQVGKR